MLARYSKAMRVVLLVALTTAALSTHAIAQSPASDPEVQAQISLFSAWLDGQIEIRGLPGVVVGVVSGDELVWARGFGHADVDADRPMDTDTRFRMASHSKLFTATAIMQLREQGKLRLDDPVREYLPWFTFQGAAPDDPPVTIEHLLTHSSGLPREAGSHWTDWDFPTADEIRELMPDRQAPFSPEVRWKYSNLAYTIAGMVVEEVSGMSWADYLHQNIFGPLGMSASSVDQPDPKLATGYGSRMPDDSREVIPFVDARGMAAATGLTSTVEDMARFVSAQFRHGSRGEDRLLGTSSLREMHRVRMLETTWTRGQGIGFSVQRIDGKLYVGHGGGYPGYTTNTMIQLDSRVGVIVLTNTNDSNPAQIAGELMSTVGDAVAAATKPEQESVAWDPAWERFAGLYRNRWGGTRVLVMNERLVMMDPWATRVGEPTELEPIGDGTFRMVAPTGGGAVGEIVRFVEEGGEVVRMITGDSYARRVR
ncbi:MAG: beta-lactamase family protein [Gemmatimonadota bacterium]|nr:beta-lactamase family protein [Gemmatimonadota bacterium]MDH5760942.1 beta-lactamase family protein [Gemmatimonadota bacterium]